MSQWQHLAETVLKRTETLPSEYQTRLKFELKEIDKQGANDYWLGVIRSGKKFDTNPNGLVLPFVLGITPVDPIKAQSNFVIDNTGEPGEIAEITLDSGETVSVPVQAFVRSKSGPILVKDLQIGDELV
jgi:hypothetical protein